VGEPEDDNPSIKKFETGWRYHSVALPDMVVFFVLHNRIYRNISIAIYSVYMANRAATNTTNKTSRSKKTRKRIEAKYAKLAAKAAKKRK